MSLRVSNIRLGIDTPESELPARVGRLLDVPIADLGGIRILRKSLDARDKDSLAYVYVTEVTLPSAPAKLEKLLERARRRNIPVEPFHEEPFVVPDPGREPLPNRPVVVGSGPAGLLAGYVLAELGYKPLVLERGRAVRDRIRDVKAFDEGGPFDPESNYLFGEGGAGTFSDGKLTYRGSGADVRRVLEIFAKNNGKPSILYEQRPHLGSNRLPAVVKKLRTNIEAMGGEVRYGCKVEDLDIADGQVRGVMTSSGHIPAEVVLMGPGHSARDTFTMLLDRGVMLERKAFQFGVRIEQPQEVANRVKYGDSRLENRIGPADYSLVVHGSRALFTFCMCAGGYIMPSVSREGEYCTNGMSLANHDSPFANSGLVVTIEPEEFGGDDPLAGVRMQEKYERMAYELGRGGYVAPMQRASDFMAGRATGALPAHTHPRGAVSARMEEVVPPLVADALRTGLPLMDRKWGGRFLPESTLAGPESRGSSPVRITRDPATRQSLTVSGIYPIGEGAGYAGGIVSAGLDGLRSALAIVARHRPTG
ncbi:MAG: NAD(P)/FAD-dependent oxidoreductase [Gemmataceae bacterium]